MSPNMSKRLDLSATFFPDHMTRLELPVMRDEKEKKEESHTTDCTVFPERSCLFVRRRISHDDEWMEQ